MLNTHVLEDYILVKNAGDETVFLGNHRGCRRLNKGLLAETTVDVDLNQGMENFNDNENRKKLCPFLKWMIKKSPKGFIEEVLNDERFVCRRTVLSRMAQGQYQDWQVVCERRGGVIYIQEEMTFADIMKKVRRTPKEKAAMYWGLRFSQYVTESPSTENGKVSTFSNIEMRDELRMVASATLTNSIDPLKILYSGEVDSVDGDEQYVKTKVVKNYGGVYGPWFWEDKSRHLWLQSRLGNAGYIVIGERGKEGRLHKMKTMKLEQLENQKTWSPALCLDVLWGALHFIDLHAHEGLQTRIACTDGHLTTMKISPGEVTVHTEEFVDHFKL